MEKSLIEDISDWMEKFKKTSIKMASYDRLETSRNLLSCHPIANICTKDLTEEILQDYVNDLTDRGYSLSTIKNIVTSAGFDKAWWTGITVAGMLCIFLVIQSVLMSWKKKAMSGGDGNS